MRKIFCVMLCVLALGFCAVAEGASSISLTLTLGEEVEFDEDTSDTFTTITDAVDGIATGSYSDYGITDLTIIIPSSFSPYSIEDEDGADAEKPLFGNDYDFGKITSLTIQGQGNVTLVSPAGSRHFTINDRNIKFMLANVTLEKHEEDEYDEESPDISGGVEIIAASRVSFDSVIFDANYSTKYDGGTAVISGGTVTFNNCAFTSYSSVNGGTVSISNGTVNFIGCDFTSNASGNGGAASISGGTVNFRDCNFASYASGNGGAVDVAGGTVTFSGNNQFISCTAANGGAINISNGTATVSNDNTFTSCTAANGGAVNISGGTANLNRNTFTSCNADVNGGAVNVTGGTTITFGSNTFEKCTAYDGGAVRISNGTTINFTGSNRFSDNISSSNGGAISITGGTTINFTGSNTFNDNVAAINGGAVNIIGGSTLNLAGMAFSGNSADLGGAIYTNKALTFGSSISFSTGNKANQGGALYIYEGLTTIDDTANFSGNSATEGGAIYLYRGNITTKAASFTGNTAAGNGGAVYISSSSQENSFGGNVEFTSNIAGGVNASWPNEGATLTDGFGGAIYIANGGIAVFSGQADFNNNRAINGGALYLAGSSATFSGNSNSVTSTGNSAVNGGAIYLADGSSLVFEGTTTFSNNSARDNGGAIIVIGNPAKFSFYGSSNSFNSNKANSDNRLIGGGGAIFWAASNITALTSGLGSATFSENSTGGNNDIYTEGYNTSGSGGALFISADRGTITIGSSYIFTGNNAYYNGGAIYTTANIMFSDSIFNSSYTSAANHDGGFVYAEGNINLYSVDINCSNITAGHNGGFAYAEGNISVAEASALYSDGSTTNAGGYGGGLYSEGMTRIDNTILHGFRAKAGGAVYSSGELTINSADIYSNSALGMDSGYEGGGAVYGNGKATITSGRFANNSTNGDFNSVGGGAVFASGDLEVTGTLFTGNIHTAYTGDTSCGGGAIYSTGGLKVTDCIFENNRVLTIGSGGAVYLSKNSASEVSFVNCLFSSDIAAERGGAIFANTNGIMTMETLSFVNNGTNTGAGGAVYAASQILNINRSYFFNNIARNREGGGALFFYQSANTVSIVECVFKENAARNGNGGAAYIVARSGSILRTTFDGNQASRNSTTGTSDTKGGALYVQTDVSSTAGIEIDTCTFANNQVSGGNIAKGGALYTAGLVGSVKVKSSTFTLSNWAVRGRGGAIYVEAPMYIVASIVVGNLATNGDDIYLEGGLTSGGYNRVGVVSNTATTSTATDWSIVNGDTETDKTPRDSRPEVTEWTTATFFGSNTLDRNTASNNSSSSPKPPLVGVALEDVSPEAKAYIETIMLSEDVLLPLETRAMDAIPRSEASRLELASDGIDQRGETRPLPVGGPLDIGAYEVYQPGDYDPGNPTKNFSIQSVFMSGIPNIMRSLGQTVSLIAMVRYSNGMTTYNTYSNPNTEPVTWSSSNQNIIRIDSNGTITAIAPTPGNDYVTIGVRTRTASDGSYAVASSPVRVILQYSYMNISTEWQTYFADYVREIAEHDIAVSIEDSNPSSVSSYSFQKNFKSIWNVNSAKQITNISGVTPEFSTASVYNNSFGLVPAKDIAVSINYKGRNNGDILPLKYLWTFSEEDLREFTGSDTSIASATTDDIFNNLQIDFEGKEGTWTVVGDGGVSAKDAISSGAMTITKIDGGKGIMVELKAYLANIAASANNGPQLVKSNSKSLLVIPDGSNDGAIIGTMWVASRTSRSSITIRAQSGIASGGSGAGGEEAGGCEALGLGLLGAALFFAFRRK